MLKKEDKMFLKNIIFGIPFTRFIYELSDVECDKRSANRYYKWRGTGYKISIKIDIKTIVIRVVLISSKMLNGS